MINSMYFVRSFNTPPPTMLVISNTVHFSKLINKTGFSTAFGKRLNSITYANRYFLAKQNKNSSALFPNKNVREKKKNEEPIS